MVAPRSPMLTGSLFVLILSVGTCARAPRGKIRLPHRIGEASGLLIRGDTLLWHNDSGDGPYLYATDLAGQLIATDTLNARARDYEDICEDEAGLIYVADTGNNAGRRSELAVYRYHPRSGTTDSIVFTYPGQDGSGRLQRGNHDCEAIVASNGYVHLFTKDYLGKGGRSFTSYHFRLPARPGHYVAELVDSLHLPRRVITGAALDHAQGELYLVGYNYRKLLGFLPSSSASVIRLADYPEQYFLRGTLTRRNIAWAVPTQHEAIGIYDDDWLYVGAEATRIRKRAIARRIERRSVAD